MIKNKIYIAIILPLILWSCQAGFESIALNENYMTSIHSGEEATGKLIEISGKPVLKHNKGDLLKDRSWWGLTGITVEQTKEGIVFDFNNIGPTYTPFGADLPLLNFEKDKVCIRIKAKAEGKNGDVPIFSLQFDDAEGIQANANRPEARIGNTEDYQYYYFDCSNMWNQTYPNKQKVNAKIINKTMVFINPGGSGYTGKIYISEMVALPIDSLQNNPEFKIPVGREGGVVSHFNSNDLSAWSSGDNYKLSWESTDSCLKVVCNDAGPDYGSFGVKLPETMNMKMAAKIKIKARYEGDGYPELRIDAKDFNGYITNSRPSTNWLEPTENGDFMSYLYIYKDNMEQMYPVQKQLDAERITGLLFFVNPGKKGWSGTIYIDDIEIIYTGIGGRNSTR